MKRAALLSIQLLGLAAAGCAALPPPARPGGAPAPGQPPAGELPGAEMPDDRAAPGSAEPPAPAGASEALLLQSREQRDAGSLGAAAASIERALRIDPNNAALWVELGEIRLAEGNVEQAEMMARKALTLAADGRVEARARRLIGH